jgi:ribosome biogenesis protein Nip4
MSYKQQVQKLQNDIIDNIKRFVAELGQDELHFREMFQVWVTESTYDDDYTRVSYAAVGLRGEFVICNSEVDEQEIQLGELDIYELSHIMDLLVANQFETN